MLAHLIFESRTEEVLTCLLYEAMEARLSPELRDEIIVLLGLGLTDKARALIREIHHFHVEETPTHRILFDGPEAIFAIPQPWSVGLPGGSDEPFGFDA